MVGIDDTWGKSRLGTIVAVARFCCSCFVFVILCLKFSYPGSFPCYYFATLLSHSPGHWSLHLFFFWAVECLFLSAPNCLYSACLFSDLMSNNLLAPRRKSCTWTQLSCSSTGSWHAPGTENLSKMSSNSPKLPLKCNFGLSFGYGLTMVHFNTVQMVEPQCQLSKHENFASLSLTNNIAFLTSVFNMTLWYYLTRLIVRTTLLMFYLFVNNSETQDRKR